jgi:phospholipid transport system substrate-binding protein
MLPAQRKAITETLRDVVEQNYVSQLRSNLSYDIRYDGEEGRGEDRLAHTTILAQRRGRPFQVRVDYVLHPQAGGGFRAYDVITDGVSLLENYRGQFNRIIKRDGVDGLIKRMRARLERGGTAEGSPSALSP